MNSFHRKLALCLSVVVFCFHLFGVPADAVDSCAGRWCCCVASPMDRHGRSVTAVSVEHECCSSPQKVPCHLDKNRMRDRQIFVTSVAMRDLQPISNLMAITNETTAKLQPFSGSTTKSPCWAVTDPIPIYLQNLTLIC